MHHQFLAGLVNFANVGPQIAQDEGTFKTRFPRQESRVGDGREPGSGGMPQQRRLLPRVAGLTLPPGDRLGRGERWNRGQGLAFPQARRARPSPMTVSFVHLQPLVALLAGILILLVPRLLNYIVAIYLIIIGITGLVR
jgi:hypothetical protein